MRIAAAAIAARLRRKRARASVTAMPIRASLPGQLVRRAGKLLQLRRRRRLEQFYELDEAPADGVDTSAPLRLVLHVGVHKTGSTSIQQTLVKEHLRLRDEGVLYPAGLFFDGQHSLLFRLINRGSEAEKRRFFLSLRALANRERCHTVILSGEQLSLMKRSSLRHLQPILKAANFDPLVVMFERRPLALLRSRMAQRMVSVADAYVTPYSLSRVMGDYDIGLLRKNFIAAFGPERVARVHLAPDDDAVARFAQTVGISLPSGTRRNVSVDFAVMSLLNGIKADFDLSSITIHSAYEAVFGSTRRPFQAETRFLREMMQHLDETTRTNYEKDMKRLEARPLKRMRRDEQIRYLRDLERFIRQLRKDHSWALKGRQEARSEGKVRGLKRLGLGGGGT